MNLRNFLSNKKKILIPLLITVVLGTGGFFYWWWQYYETPPEKWDSAEYSKPEDYEVIETSEGIIVENKKAGLSFKVPEGWRVEKEKYRDYIALFSEDAEGPLIMKKGCKITTEIRYFKTDLQTIEEILKEGHEKWGYIDEYEIIEIGRHKALKNTTGIANLNQFGIGIHVPLKKILKSNLYYIGLSSNLQERERCTQEFEKFLETVSIE